MKNKRENRALLFVVIVPILVAMACLAIGGVPSDVASEAERVVRNYGDVCSEGCSDFEIYAEQYVLSKADIANGIDDAWCVQLEYLYKVGERFADGNAIIGISVSGGKKDVFGCVINDDYAELRHCLNNDWGFSFGSYFCQPKTSNVESFQVEQDGLGANEEVESTEVEYYSDRPDNAEYLSFNRHYYLVVKERLSWDEAMDHCVNMGGYLATISSEIENDFILKVATRRPFPDYSVVWIGATDEIQESRWEWVTGELVTMPEKLDASGGTGENYLNLRLSTGMWEDYTIYGESVGEQWLVCEWDN